MARKLIFSCLVALLNVFVVEAIPTIQRYGSRFYDSNGDQFFVKGIRYYNFADRTDPMTDQAQCENDVKVIKQLGANVVAIYSQSNALIDPCMRILRDNGIYVLATLSGGYDANYGPAQNTSLWKSYSDGRIYSQLTSTFDGLAVYENLFAVTIRQDPQISESVDHDTALALKAAARDLKAYRDARGHRQVPIGYLAEFKTPNSTNPTVAGMNEYSHWLGCGQSNSTVEFATFHIQYPQGFCSATDNWGTSGYNNATTSSEDLGFPAYFSTPGCATSGAGATTNFVEQDQMFGNNQRLSGDLVGYWQAPEGYFALCTYSEPEVEVTITVTSTTTSETTATQLTYTTIDTTVTQTVATVTIDSTLTIAPSSTRYLSQTYTLNPAASSPASTLISTVTSVSTATVSVSVPGPTTTRVISSLSISTETARGALIPTLLPQALLLASKWASINPNTLKLSQYLSSSISTVTPSCPASRANFWPIDRNAVLPTIAGLNLATVSRISGAPTGSPSPSAHGLSTGAKAGIGVGVALAVLAIIILAILFFLRRRKRQSHQNDSVIATPSPAMATHAESGYTKAELSGVGGPIAAQYYDDKQPIPQPQYELPTNAYPSGPGVRGSELMSAPIHEASGSSRSQIMDRDQQFFIGDTPSSKRLTTSSAGATGSSDATAVSPSQPSQQRMAPWVTPVAAPGSILDEDELAEEADIAVQELGLIAKKKRVLVTQAEAAGMRPQDVEGRRGEDFRALVAQETRVRARLAEIDRQRGYGEP